MDPCLNDQSAERTLQDEQKSDAPTRDEKEEKIQWGKGPRVPRINDSSFV